jgi:ribonucleotide monophosphatase NagD (HAD superfamily)
MQAMNMINRVSKDCIKVGGRLDTDIRSANKLGIKNY